MTRTLTLKTQAPQSLVRATERGGTYTRRKVARGLLIQRIGFYVVALLTVISMARAGTVSIQGLTAAQFASAFGAPAPTFNGIVLPVSQFIFEPAPFPLGSLTFGDLGNSDLFVEGSGQGFDIGTGHNLLVDEGPNTTNASINITFAKPVAVIGLIAGDAFGGPPGGDAALFNVTFADASSITGIGSDGSLPITGGNTPSYFRILDTGVSGISQLNFSDSAGFPTLDTVTATVPEPNSGWLPATLILALGIGSVMRKRKIAAARLGSGAAPLALLAVFAILAVPSRSFAQVNCNLAVPNNPLTAVGLGTPYLLSAGDAGCSQGGGTMAFAQAAIYDPAAHTISLYTPLIADAPPNTPGQPRTPRYAISPVVPHLPANAVVAIWFGYNANNLTLTGTGVTSGNCFTGFGQYAACNTTAFWAAVNADTTLLSNIWNAFKGQNGSDGQACPTSRSYSIVDQDPTDNLPVSFLLTAETPTRTAQDTVANRANLTGRGITFSTQINPSDEVVVDRFIDGALGCNPPIVADLTDPGTNRASLAVNELFAGLQSGQFPAINPTSIYGNGANQLRGPGLVAIGDTFTLVPTFTQPNSFMNGCVLNGATGSCTYPYTGGDITAFDNYVAAMGYAQTNPQTISGTLSTGAGTAFARTNQYRASTNQPLASVSSTTGQDGTTADASVQTFCTKMYTRTAVGDNSPANLLFNKDFVAFNQAGNGPGASDLFVFLGARFAASYDLLGCEAVFGKSNPVNVTNVNATVPGNGVIPLPPAPPFYYPAVFP